MKIIILILTCLLAFTNLSFAKDKENQDTIRYFGSGLCNTPGYHCIKVKGGQTWNKLFPNEQQRDIVQRVNRTNMWLAPGRTIAVPDDLAHKTIYDVAPFPKHIKAPGQTLIIVDQDKLAWGAFNKQGELIKWGPISSGKNFCPDIKRSCKTISGSFYVFNKKDGRCRSNTFPVGRGGSVMPYCMFFFKGYALHGSNEVRGWRDSHGCVRLFTRDAKWLNHEFVELPSKENNNRGTKVVVQKLVDDTIVKR